jgi:hypothetical protein
MGAVYYVNPNPNPDEVSSVEGICIYVHSSKINKRLTDTSLVLILGIPTRRYILDYTRLVTVPW